MTIRREREKAHERITREPQTVKKPEGKTRDMGEDLIGIQTPGRFSDRYTLPIRLGIRYTDEWGGC